MSTESRAVGTPPLSGLVASACVGLLAGSLLYGALFTMGDLATGVDQFLRAYLAGAIALLLFSVIILLPATSVLRRHNVNFGQTILVLLGASLVAAVIVALAIGSISGGVANALLAVGTAALFLVTGAVLFSAFFARRRRLSVVVVGVAALVAAGAGLYAFLS